MFLFLGNFLINFEGARLCWKPKQVLKGEWEEISEEMVRKGKIWGKGSFFYRDVPYMKPQNAPKDEILCLSQNK